MSTATRTAQRGGKNAKTETSLPNKPQKPEPKIEPPKVLEKVQPTAEQMRIAEIMDPKLDDPSIKEKIKQVMDLTQKSEDEVSTALFDCDNDANRAVNYLLEGNQSEWSTSVVKKKKNRTASTTKADGTVNNHVGGSGGEGEDWDSPQGEEGGTPTGGRGRGGPGREHDRERPRQRGGGPPRLRGRGGQNENRGWRGRENKENERNLEEGYGGERNSGGRRGERSGRMSNGPGRSGRGGRGGGRLGPRTFQSRDKPGQGFPRSIDTWNNPSTDDNSGEKMENWDDNGAKEDWDTDPKVPGNENWADGFPSPEDWDNEEYTGSLADSKVFTPSTGPEPPPTTAPSTLPILNKDEELTVPSNTSMPQLNHDQQQQQSRPSQLSSSPVSVALTAAQSQYFTQLTQGSESYKSAVGLGASPTYAVPPQQAAPTQQTVYPAAPSPNSAYTATSSVAYTTSNYGVPVNSYSSSLQEVNSVAQGAQTLPSRSKTQRPRVPPPSKIPSSAVEMPPGDVVGSGIGFLDVQFGGVEFGAGESTGIESTTSESVTQTPSIPVAIATPSVPVVAPTSIPTSVTPAVASVMEAYSTSVSSTPQQTNMSSPLTQTQKLAANESMLQSETSVSSGYGSSQNSVRSANTAANNALTELSNSSSKASTAVDVSLAYNSVSESYQTPTYQKTQATPSYQTPVSTYNSSNYSTSQVTSNNSGYNSSQTTGYTPSSSGAYGATSSTGAQSTQSVNSYPNTNSYGAVQQTTSYTYQSYPAASSYQSGGQAYPQQSAYGGGAGTAYPYQNSYAASNPPTATVQQNHKMTAALNSTTKDSQYDSGSASSSNIPSATTVSATPSLGLSTSQTAASTKVTAISTASKSGLVPSIPPGVPPMLSTQYIMSQGGLPYFHQAQPVYSYEELQMLQQRIPPHLATGYYADMGFQQAPTSLATGREASLGNVAYSMSDGRFARADNNASPVPSTLSQQNTTQGHQQPMLNHTALPPGYAYAFYGGSMIPAGTQFQYGTPALYPVAPTAAASGHGNSSSGQYKGPGGYGSAGGYGSGYEAGAADYSKVGGGAGGYASSPAQTKATAGTPTGANPSSSNTDLSASMYGKSHATLSKVNSYDKQGFHSGTPPPFNIPGSQNTGLAPSGGFAPQLYIPTLPPHQHHTTALMHQPLHQMDMRNQGRRMDGGSNSGPRSQASAQPNKPTTKQNYSNSYWAPN